MQVRRHEDKEYQVFPRERAKAFGASTGSLAALKPEGDLEGGLEALLKQHGLEEGKAVKGEGMPKHGTPSEFGDLTITFSVEFPTAVDGELAAGLQKLLPEFTAADMKIGQ